MEKSYINEKISIWLVLATLAIFTLSIHSTAKESYRSRAKAEELALASSTLNEAERKMLRMKLKRTHNVRYSRASWYGGYFHGRTTANMEVFDKNMLTAAHKTLKLGTYLLVTNLNNNKDVIVRVNDRGPYVKGRDLDLSEAAAKLIDSHNKGVVPIRYEILTRA